MGSEQVNPNGAGNEPELHLLLANESFEEPLYKSLFRELDEFFFPKKLPPLKLESKPEPVKDIWGFYNNRKNGALGSTGVHVLIVGIVALQQGRDFAAKYADMAFLHLDPSNLDALKAHIESYRRLAREEYGREIQIWCNCHVTQRETQKEAEDYLRYYVVENVTATINANAPSRDQSKTKQNSCHFQVDENKRKMR